MIYSELRSIISATTQIPRELIERFLAAELLLYVADQLGETTGVSDFYLLLQNRELMVQTRFSPVDIRLRYLRTYLREERLRERWLGDLAIYQSDECKLAGIYDISSEEDKFELYTPNRSFTASRLDLYAEFLNTHPMDRVRSFGYATSGNDTEYAILRGYGEQPELLSFPDPIEPFQVGQNTPKLGGTLHISMYELLSAAKELDMQSGTTYREEVLRSSRLLCGTNASPADRITLDGLVNLLGQVGAGKSTIADPLALVIACRGGRILFVEQTLPKIQERVEMFRSCGISTVAAFSRRGESRRTQAEALARSPEIPPEGLSSLIETGCCLAPFLHQPNRDIPIGEEPCCSLHQKDETRIRTKNYVCPFYYQCPTTQREAEIRQASIIVTTPAGLGTLRLGPERSLLLKYAAEYMDLVILDEADAIQGQLDSLFSKTLPANDYIRDSEAFQNTYLRMSLSEKSAPLLTRCKQLLGQFESTLVAIISRIEREANSGFAPSYLKAFTSLRLIDYLEKRHSSRRAVPLCAEDNERLRAFASGKFSAADRQMLHSIYIDTISMETHLELCAVCKPSNYSDNKAPDAWRQLQRGVYFVLLVIAFERAHMELSNLVAGNPALDSSLSRILTQTFREQQALLPVACATGALRLEYHPGKDLFITQQFLTGRALLYALPKIHVTPEHIADGPHVLLMSGTSICPGSRDYHIPLAADYIVEAPEEKRIFLEQTQFVFPQVGICVSGSPEGKKDAALQALIREQFPLIHTCLMEGEHILFITNSYAQAFSAAIILNTLLRKANSMDQACYLVPDKAEDSKDALAIRRKDLTSFTGSLLTAPAVVLERGHNIVDEWGNAHFHTLMLAVRPLPDPTDYTMQMRKINGQMIQIFWGKSSCTLELCKELRKKAFALSYHLKEQYLGYRILPEEDKLDVCVSLFVTLIQLIGRISRAGAPDQATHTPKVIFLDGAFSQKPFLYREFLLGYLEDLINCPHIQVASRTLYGPFYQALKKGELKP